MMGTNELRSILTQEQLSRVQYVVSRWQANEWWTSEPSHGDWERKCISTAREMGFIK
jgi:hypothetical protein